VTLRHERLVEAAIAGQPAMGLSRHAECPRHFRIADRRARFDSPAVVAIHNTAEGRLSALVADLPERRHALGAMQGVENFTVGAGGKDR
jgi:hypothetical protein